MAEAPRGSRCIIGRRLNKAARARARGLRSVPELHGALIAPCASGSPCSSGACAIERVPVFAFGPAMAFTYSHSAENGQPQ